MRSTIICSLLLVSGCDSNNGNNNGVNDLSGSVTDDGGNLDLSGAINCGLVGEACAGNGACCSNNCDSTAHICLSSTAMCKSTGEACNLPTECCGVTCTNAKCG